jgi:hypothetical protein
VRIRYLELEDLIRQVERRGFIIRDLGFAGFGHRPAED